MVEKYKIQGIPDSAYYIANFLTEEEEKTIWDNVYKAPKPKWTNLVNRRVQNWGGHPHTKGMITEKIPPWLIKQMKKIEKLNVFPATHHPNHVLVNEYKPGQGIMRHLDGPLFFPVICTITCGSHNVLNFHPPFDKYADCSKQNQVITSILLERRSLVIIKDDLYHIHPHSIEETRKDMITPRICNLYLCGERFKIDEKLRRDTRISLTIRHVPNASRFKLTL